MNSEATSDENRRTVAAYEAWARAYVADVQACAAKNPEAGGHFREWLETAVSDLDPRTSTIFEFGSGAGRKALSLGKLGYAVEATDAASTFVEIMRQNGLAARQFDILQDPLPADRDLIFASGVVQHFTFQQARQVFQRVSAALKPTGRFALTVPTGQFEGWQPGSTGLEAQARYWRCWPEDELHHCLAEFNLDDIVLSRTISYRERPWLLVVAQKSGRELLNQSDPAGANQRG